MNDNLIACPTGPKLTPEQEKSFNRANRDAATALQEVRQLMGALPTSGPADVCEHLGELVGALEDAAESAQAQYLALAYVWVLSPQFDAPLDVAIREWGKTSKLAARTIIDQES